MKTKIIILLTGSLLFCQDKADANLITATPSNYTSFISGLVPGDTLYLSAGSYTSGLTLNNLNGTASEPIVIMGVSGSFTSILVARSCCNTVSITKCSYMVIENLKIDGKNMDGIDGVKAEGTAGNWAHHITLENLYIVHNGGSTVGNNQTDAISTKCSAWNWTIRNCTIIAAGTGLYLGNSDGSDPFVSGLIENNLVINTRGYNMEIKEQLDNVRDNFPGTSNDYQKTIIRYNVWSKDSGATPIGVGDGSRPCILMDNFPAKGNGANDTYEVYGNFFYNNPTEALMQITGNTTAYNNVFVNNVAPSGYYTIVINDHNSFPPRNINMFHNTILSNSPTGGISLSNPNTNYQQYCYANAVFCAGTPINGFTTANNVDNTTDTYVNAATFLNSPSTTLSLLNLYPKIGQLQGALTSNTLFTGYTDYNIDFNGNTYNWIYRGAYSGSGVNSGWHLQLDTMPTPHGTISGITESHGVNDFLDMVYPNPATNSFELDLQLDKITRCEVILTNIEGQTLKTLYNGEMVSGSNKITTDVIGLVSGFYLVKVQLQDRTITRKILIQK